ncbi:taste receptor type 2 member 39-like [Phyllobates terribilis]|uniref:taste receptor type 2 member 39-like n=1 Tax=Phyllobates terribilis TaxID=111132 RepID=UPI003CCB62E3
MDIFPFVLLLETFTGLSSSIFIITCLSLTGFQKTNFAPLNRILISLNTTNVLYTMFMSAYFLVRNLWPYFYSDSFVFYFLSTMSLYTITSTAWLTGTLCFFYFMKIVPSHPGVVMKIRNRISAIVWRLILMAQIVSFSGSFLSTLLSLQTPNGKNSTMNVEAMVEKRSRRLKFTSAIMMLNCLPFALTIVMTFASAWFLRWYNCQIRKNSGTLVNTNVKDYRTAVQTMTGLLILYLLVIIAAICLAIEIFADGSEEYWICAMALLSFPTGQSTLLIYSNPKLRQILNKLISFLTCTDSGE